jgi:hypothetical protein
MNAEKREMVARARKIGSCQRCKSLKKTVCLYSKLCRMFTLILDSADMETLCIFRAMIA